MTNVIELAKQAGLEFQENTGITGRKKVTTYGSQPIEKIELLIKLVRNAALEEAAQKCEQDYRLQEARRAHADSMTLGGANHAYFNEVMERLTVTAQDIRNLKEPTP